MRSSKYGRTGGLIVVAFNGSLSPEIREGCPLAAPGDLGDIAQHQRHVLAVAGIADSRHVAADLNSFPVAASCLTPAPIC